MPDQYCPLCDGDPKRRGRRFQCFQHTFLTEEIWKAAQQKQELILDRVEMFQDDITQEAEHELATEFHLTDQQADEIMGVV